MGKDVFIDVDSWRYSKHGRSVNGDVTLTRKVGGGRIISILCDGLGSGVEANVLASFTASMGIEYMAEDKTVSSAAELIMDALPVCPTRKISYSTFSIADLSVDYNLRIIEHGNPPFIIFRGDTPVQQNCQELHRPRWQNRKLQYAHLNVKIGDRVILMSDGVTQSGLGSKKWPMGCGFDRVCQFISEKIRLEPQISSGELCRFICNEALVNDCFYAGDDITCLIMYIRQPRVLRILTGPPVDPKKDSEYANILRDWKGKCVICGGTTANIVERELKRTSTVNMQSIDPVVPATSDMDGVDLVTEGCITLGCCAGILESGDLTSSRQNGAVMLRDLLLSSDIIEFYVGTRINQAHQDPDLPLELDIRRNMIKKICSILETKHFKETYIRYF